MSMTASRPRKPHEWTIDDLADIPDDGNRYELHDGELLVSPAAKMPHHFSIMRLFRTLSPTCPPDLFIITSGAGADLGRRRTYYIPDLVVVPVGVATADINECRAADLVLAVEVLSADNRRNDLARKRHGYGRAGVPNYWIVDGRDRSLSVLTDPYEDGYREEVTIKAGDRWTTRSPFPVTLDPADFT